MQHLCNTPACTYKLQTDINIRRTKLPIWNINVDFSLPLSLPYKSLLCIALSTFNLPQALAQYKPMN